MRTLADLLDRNADLHGEAPAVAGDGRRTTHRAHRDRARRLADALLASGLAKGDRFAVLAQNRPEYLELYAAADASGLVLVTLNWRLAPAELAAILADCTPAAVLHEARFDETVAALRASAPAGLRWIAFERDYESLVAAGTPRAPAVPPAPDDLACIIYTSGTTGRPKGVMLSHTALLASAMTIAASAAHSAADRMLVVMPLFHVGARIESLAVQAAGGSLLVDRQFDPLAWFTAVERERASVAHLAPVMVKTLVEHPERPRFDTRSLRRIHYGSAPVSPDELGRAIAAFGPILAQLYGMTEHLLSSMLQPGDARPDGDARDIARLASAGRAYPGTGIRIVDAAGRDLPAGGIGEIVVRSRGMMSGYWNQPALTAEVLREGWLHTGDVGTLDADGFLTIVDRRKDMIVSGGENIYSREVENALAAHPAVLEAAVIGVPDARWGEAVQAFVILREGVGASEAELIEHCRARIASYKKPRAVAFVADFPRLATRKVDKKALRAPYWAGRGRAVG